MNDPAWDGSFTATGDLPPSAILIIGKGPFFPFGFSGGGSVRTVQVAQGVDKINQSIHLILTTRPGERFMNPEFGSLLSSLIFEPNDQLLRDLLWLYTVEALERWEQRIQITQVTFPSELNDIDNAIIRIRIAYQVRQTSVAGSYVFPFQRYPEPMSQVVTGRPVSAPAPGMASLVSPFDINQLLENR